MYVPQKSVQEVVPQQIEAPLFDSGCRRMSTAVFHHQAIKNAIAMMYERFSETVTLQDMADAAQLSQFHFNRIFSKMTGVSPSTFLAAIRLQQAKNLLVTTQSSVTEVCFDVGYRSLGTFTSRFTSLVGMPPSHFRHLLQADSMLLRPLDLWDTIHGYIQNEALSDITSQKALVRGNVRVEHPFQGLIVIGLFADPVPQGMPIRCTMLTSTGQFSITHVPDGQYHLFAAALEISQDFLTAMTKGVHLHGRVGRYALDVQDGNVRGCTDITLVPTSWIDPPLILALPWLLLSRFMSS